MATVNPPNVLTKFNEEELKKKGYVKEGNKLVLYDTYSQNGEANKYVRYSYSLDSKGQLTEWQEYRVAKDRGSKVVVINEDYDFTYNKGQLATWRRQNYTDGELRRDINYNFETGTKTREDYKGIQTFRQKEIAQQKANKQQITQSQTLNEATLTIGQGNLSQQVRIKQNEGESYGNFLSRIEQVKKTVKAQNITIQNKQSQYIKENSPYLNQKPNVTYFSFGIPTETKTSQEPNLTPYEKIVLLGKETPKPYYKQVGKEVYNILKSPVEGVAKFSATAQQTIYNNPIYKQLVKPAESLKYVPFINERIKDFSKASRQLYTPNLLKDSDVQSSLSVGGFLISGNVAPTITKGAFALLTAYQTGKTGAYFLQGQTPKPKDVALTGIYLTSYIFGGIKKVTTKIEATSSVGISGDAPLKSFSGGQGNILVSYGMGKTKTLPFQFKQILDKTTIGKNTYFTGERTIQMLKGETTKSKVVGVSTNKGALTLVKTNEGVIGELTRPTSPQTFVTKIYKERNYNFKEIFRSVTEFEKIGTLNGYSLTKNLNLGSKVKETFIIEKPKFNPKQSLSNVQQTTNTATLTEGVINQQVTSQILKQTKPQEVIIPRVKSENTIILKPQTEIKNKNNVITKSTTKQQSKDIQLLSSQKQPQQTIKNIKIKQDITTDLKQEQESIFKPKTGQVTSSLSSFTFDIFQEQQPQTGIKTNQDIKQVQTPNTKLSLKQSTPQKPIYNQTQTPIQNTIYSHFVNFSSGSNKQQETGFNVFARIKGQFEKININPLSKNQALNFGSSFVDSSSSATFKIQETSSKAYGFFGGGGKLNKFYKKNNLFIEKNAERISTGGELSEITFNPKNTRGKNKNVWAF